MLCMNKLVITARKRSLGQGNIFTSVCHSFCPGGGCLHPGGSASQRGLHPEGSAFRGRLHPGESTSRGSTSRAGSSSREVCIQGGSPSRGGGWLAPSHRILWMRSTNRRYVSYWNALLVTYNFCSQ